MIVEVIRGLNLGGAETLLYTRLRHSAANRPGGFEDTVVINTLKTNNYYVPRIRALGVRVIELEAADPWRGLVELRRTLKGLRGVSTIVFHSPVTTYLEKCRAALNLGDRSPRLVEVVHSTRYRPLYLMAGKILDKFADLGIAVGKDVAEAPTTAGFRSVRTVPSGVDSARMRQWIVEHPQAPERMRAELGVKEPQRLAVTVGSLIPLKGHRFVIEALTRPGLENVALALVGDGPERGSLEALATELGVNDRVYFVGRVDDAWRWTAIADVLVHPSFFEGLPVAVMEAAALGTPVLGTDVGGLSQIIEGSDQGRLIVAPDADLIADELRDMLYRAPAYARTFETRASVESFWSMGRYAEEFYRTISS